MKEEYILDDFKEDEPEKASIIPRYIGLLRLIISGLFFILVLVSSLRLVLEAIQESGWDLLGSVLFGIAIVGYFFFQMKKGFKELNQNFKPSEYWSFVVSIIISSTLLFILLISAQDAILNSSEIDVLGASISLILIASFSAFIFYDIKHIRFVSRK
ncbi:MAG: hypothetical protein ACPG5P_01815 [Saprospiraceae bacterium]